MTSHETKPNGAALASPLDRPLSVTFFTDYSASLARRETTTLRDILPLLETTEAPNKGALPWLKLASFGTKKTDRGSLRNNANVLAIDGVEADYDAEVIDVDTAAVTLDAYGLAGIIYSSPSHTDEKPRWRVLCPTSRSLQPDERASLVARLNGVFGGELAGESFTLSQSYYYGRVAGSTSHRVLVVEGQAIDEIAGLSEVGSKRKHKPVSGQAAVSIPQWLADEDELRRMLDEIKSALSAAEDGHKHDTLRSQSVLLGGILWATEWRDKPDAAAAWLVSCLPASVKDWGGAHRTALSGVGLGRKDPLPVGAAAEFGISDLQRLARGLEPVADAPPAEEPPGWRDACPGRQEGRVENERESLLGLLSVDGWINRDIPEPDRLLGDLLTTTSRMFLVGRTGLGKTMFALGIAAGIASGAGFMHWRSSRPARVLYIDGEMPTELIKPRAQDAVRRLKGAKILPGNLLIFGRDIETEARRVYPRLPPFAPLNTEAGRAFLMALIDAIGGVDLIVFDNVMSLVSGDQKDEVPWTETLPLVQALTDRRIGQLWLDHTGHNSDRQYGSSTKAWRFDAVGVMTPLKDDADPRSTAFNLSFDHPGKARRRTPDNWQQFAALTVRLADGEWNWTATTQGTAKPEQGVKPAAIAQHEALVAVLVRKGAPAATRAEWYAECVQRGLHTAVPDGASGTTRGSLMANFRARMSELVTAHWIQVSGEAVMDLRAAVQTAL